MERFKIIAFTHKSLGLVDIGKLHIEESSLMEKLTNIKEAIGAQELMYLSTCNRVEFLLSSSQSIDKKFLAQFFLAFQPQWDALEHNRFIDGASVFEGEDALKHLFSVASSIDSLVVGEREIITQVRNAFESSRKMLLSGDLIRLVIRQTIETAKQIYTETHIAKKPVSVVSLAYRKLKELNVQLDAKILIIGSGITNSTMAKYLKKHGFKNFVVVNRTLSNAEKLAKELNAEALSLNALPEYNQGFDVILTCTGASKYIITKDIYKQLVGEDTTKKIVIDLAVPNDLDPEVLTNFDINLIAVNNLQQVAKENLKEREKELDACRNIIEKNSMSFRQLLKTRKVELAMSEVPQKVKEIRDAAHCLFAKDLEQLDDSSKVVLDKILSYYEKKYISVPMKIAKQIMIEHKL